MLFSAIHGVVGIKVGDEDIGRVFLGDKPIYPYCEKNMDQRILELYEKFYPQIDHHTLTSDEMDSIYRNQLRMVEQDSTPSNTPIVLTEEQQSGLNALAQMLYGDE